MATPRNPRSLRSAFTGIDTTLKSLFVDRPTAYVEQLQYKLKHLPQTNFELGVDFATQGKWKDAAFRFKVAIYLQPGFAQAWYNLGCSQIRLNQRPAAKQSFLKSLKLAPGMRDALFMLSALDANAVPPNQRPQIMPIDMVQPFFANLAPNYDTIEARNNYQGPRVVYDALKPLLPNAQGLTVVDLGAGSGLAARPWRPIARELVAVDFTPAMAAVARNVRVADAPLFDRVLEEPIAGTTAPLSQADVVLVVNVAQFLGNLEPLLAQLSQQVKPGALVALTVEPFDIAAGYGVNIDTGRFGHHPNYVKQAATAAGLIVKQEGRVQLYPQFSALLFVLGK